MIEQDDPELREILARAAELAPQDQPSYLDRVCAGNTPRRSRIESLLKSLHEAGRFLADPTFAEGAGRGIAAECAGTVIGRYKLVEEIGEGAFGTVFVADQESPVRRQVALKIIKLGMDTREVVARFEAERQALALMDHPGIARVFDAGATEMGRPYVVMELCRGVPIHAFCDQHQWTIEQRLRLFAEVCSAVEHAHQKGIIHRDLKPSNILVVEHDGKAVPKVIDFGIAKATQGRLTDKTVMTEFRQLIGTPAYMSPEQVRINGLDVDTRSDIYSLGVLLYQLLAGATPFESKTLLNAPFEEMLRIVREVEPPRPSARVAAMEEGARDVAGACRCIDPRELPKKLRGELDWIVMKCLEKDRARRYASAGDLARDVERYLAHEMLEASPPSRWYRLEKFARRHRKGLLVAAACAALLVGAAVVSTWEATRAIRAEATLLAQQQALIAARNQAMEAQGKAEVSERHAASTLVDMYTTKGLEPSTRSKNALSALWFASAAAFDTSDPARRDVNLLRAKLALRGQWEPIAAMPLAKKYEIEELPGAGRLEFDPVDARYLLACARSSASPEACKLWDVPAESAVAWPTELGEPTAGVWLSDGQLVVGTRGGSVAVLEVPAMKIVSRWEVGEAIASVAMSDDKQTLAAATGSSLRVWPAQSKMRPLVKEHPSPVKYVAFAPGKNLLVTSTATQARVFRVTWDESAGSLVVEQAFHEVPHNFGSYVWTVPPLFLNDGSELMTNDDKGGGSWATDSSVRFYKAETGEQTAQVRINGIRTMRLSPDGKTAALSANNLILLDLPNHDHSRTMSGTNAIAFNPKSKYAALGYNASIKFTAISGTAPSFPMQIDVPGGTIWMAFAADGNTFASLGADGLLRVWKVPTDSPSSVPHQRMDEVGGSSSCAMFSPDGRYLAPSGDIDGLGDVKAMQVYDTQAAALVGERWNLPGTLMGAAFSPDGTCLAAATGQKSDPKQLRMWNWHDGRELWPPFELGAEPVSVAFSPDGQQIVVHCVDGHLYVVNPKTGEKLREAQCAAVRDFRSSPYPAVTGRRGTLIFSRDGSKFFTAGSPIVEAWDAASAKLLFAVKHDATCWGIAESPDGRILATAGRDRVVRLTDIATHMELAAIAHPSGIMDVDFSPDGKRLCTACEDGQVRVWKLSGTAGTEATLDFAFAPDASPLSGAAFSPDGKWIITTCYGSCQVFDAYKGYAIIPNVPIQGGMCHEHIDLSSDGQWAVIAGSIERKAYKPMILNLRELTSVEGVTPEQMLRRAEILSSSHIDGAAEAGLTNDQWMERWRATKTARSTDQQKEKVSP